jgi:uncharacterized protein (TIGR02265 family)
LSYDGRVSDRERAIDEVCRFCDLKERIAVIPPSAKARGVYFRSIETVLTRAGRIGPYRALFPVRVAAVPWQPLPELLIQLAVGGSILASPERVQEGMFEIGRQNAIAVSESLIGRTLIRFLSRDPRRLLQQAVAGRRQTAGYGNWTLTFPTERSAVITMVEEYLYLESYLLGAAQGTFDAISMPVQIEVVLQDRFSGKHILAW